MRSPYYVPSGKVPMAFWGYFVALMFIGIPVISVVYVCGLIYLTDLYNRSTISEGISGVFVYLLLTPYLIYIRFKTTSSFFESC